jgi:hypothetical protein
MRTARRSQEHTASIALSHSRQNRVAATQAVNHWPVHASVGARPLVPTASTGCATQHSFMLRALPLHMAFTRSSTRLAGLRCCSEWWRLNRGWMGGSFHVYRPRPGGLNRICCAPADPHIQSHQVAMTVTGFLHHGSVLRHAAIGTDKQRFRCQELSAIP